MDNQEFLSEALSYSRCPDNFKEKYTLFCKYQKMAINMLRNLDDICMKHNIHYILSSGSLLGAVRDHGQIPWDYDVDVAIPFDERKQLYSALNDDLSDDFYYCNPDNSNDYTVSFVRIVPKSFPHEIVHLDVFFVIGLPEDSEEKKQYCKKVSDYTCARKYVLESFSNYPYSFKTKIKYSLLKIKYLMKLRNEAVKYQVDLYSKYDIHKAKNVAYLTSRVGKNIDKTYRFFDTVRLDTREGQFTVPSDYLEYLSEWYGEWKKYPSIDNRIQEVMNHCSIFEWYESKSYR